jgi:hypothetical protein
MYYLRCLRVSFWPESPGPTWPLKSSHLLQQHCRRRPPPQPNSSCSSPSPSCLAFKTTSAWQVKAQRLCQSLHRHQTRWLAGAEARTCSFFFEPHSSPHLTPFPPIPPLFAGRIPGTHCRRGGRARSGASATAAFYSLLCVCRIRFRAVEGHWQRD